MKWMVWWFRSLFCKHEWDKEELKIRTLNKAYERNQYLYSWNNNNPYPMYNNNTKVIFTCKKCTWIKSYVKAWL